MARALPPLAACAAAAAGAAPLPGALFATDKHAGAVYRVRCGGAGCDGAVVAARGLDNPHGLAAGAGRLVVADADNSRVAELDPWCGAAGGCTAATVVDLARLGLERPMGPVFCGAAGTLWVSFYHGLLRCAGCAEAGRDCTDSCAVVTLAGNATGGGGAGQLSFPSQAACWNGDVAVADYGNARVSVFPGNCTPPCAAQTYALPAPGRGVAHTGSALLATQQKTGAIVAAGAGSPATVAANLSLPIHALAAGGRVVVVEKAAGTVSAFDASCTAGCTAVPLWRPPNFTGGTGIAYLPLP